MQGHGEPETGKKGLGLHVAVGVKGSSDREAFSLDQEEGGGGGFGTGKDIRGEGGTTLRVARGRKWRDPQAAAVWFLPPKRRVQSDLQ